MGNEMKKWNSFNALLSHATKIEKMMNERNKVEKPKLSEDQLEEINGLVQLATSENVVIEVKYYKSGYIERVGGCINKVDLYTKLMTVGNDEIKFDNILSISIK